MGTYQCSLKRSYEGESGLTRDRVGTSGVGVSRTHPCTLIHAKCNPALRHGLRPTVFYLTKRGPQPGAIDATGRPGFLAPALSPGCHLPALYAPLRRVGELFRLGGRIPLVGSPYRGYSDSGGIQVLVDATAKPLQEWLCRQSQYYGWFRQTGRSEDARQIAAMTVLMYSAKAEGSPAPLRYLSGRVHTALRSEYRKGRFDTGGCRIEQVDVANPASPESPWPYVPAEHAKLLEDWFYASRGERRRIAAERGCSLRDLRRRVNDAIDDIRARCQDV